MTYFEERLARMNWFERWTWKHPVAWARIEAAVAVALTVAYCAVIVLHP